MAKERCQVVWSKPAELNLDQIYEYISTDSPQNASRIISEIVDQADSISAHPEKYPPDRLFTDNDGSYRFFIKHNYRIVYRFTPGLVKILWIRHIRMQPKRS